MSVKSLIRKAAWTFQRKSQESAGRQRAIDSQHRVLVLREVLILRSAIFSLPTNTSALIANGTCPSPLQSVQHSCQAKVQSTGNESMSLGTCRFAADTRCPAFTSRSVTNPQVRYAAARSLCIKHGTRAKLRPTLNQRPQ